MSQRKSFTPEFKRETVQLLKSGSSLEIQIVGEGGIKRNHLYKWQAELKTLGEHLSASSDDKLGWIPLDWFLNSSCSGEAVGLWLVACRTPQKISRQEQFLAHPNR